ncbi:MAG: sugar nucleotide-binding protein [Sphingobium sp.]|uniref:sugar nucleotide-binding protein n=1 Tax=Sphingobium sp. TaxID=1912891 RepID=UPI0029A7F146|nr:sugar nucleotide-binding protein [Sphingobium sp.]MDX3910223.1 sugar nucleotide-binding protein [Sphingobium sp.]
MDVLELWGGHECTINRVGDKYSDQSQLSGHGERIEDLDLFAGLGLSAIRYPILWEKVAADSPDVLDWQWTDQRMVRLRDLNIRVIGGLVHHGSGPGYTNLMDDGFAGGLASYAGKVAARYPWVEDWTPVNEPLTTARFSGLYGHWYPHHKSEESLWRALLNQIDGVRLSMQAIRRVNPNARLIQTEDLGRTFATASLREQAGFENLRRWMTWDLLCGQVTRAHPMWHRITRFGFGDRLQRMADEPVPPQIIGVNHYVTSERFLDHRVQRYPPHTRGGNGEVAYSDIEGVRVLDPAPPGLAGVLKEAWSRYRIPLAVTEVHNGCTRDEQMRWMAEAWDTAGRLRDEGVDVRAVTSWSLLGSKGWNTLLTAPGVYEPGAFDVSGGAPRATAMVPLLRGLAAGAPRHPALDGSGWWRRPIRLEYPSVARPAPLDEHRLAAASEGQSDRAPLLICGATGTLGRAFARTCEHRDIAYVLTSRQDLDLQNATSIGRALEAHQPWAVVNAAGWVRVDDAQSDPDGCFNANTHGARLLAQSCARRGIQTLNFSSDLVFDGQAGRPYIETDVPTPLGIYGQSKARAEAEILALEGSHLIVRTAAFFSPFDAYNFAVATVRALEAGTLFHAADDSHVSPTYVPDLVDSALDLLIDGAEGIWHLTNGETLSWAEFARKVARATGCNPSLVRGVPGDALGWQAPRPAFAGLASVKGGMLRPLDSAIDRFAAGLERHRLMAAA